MKELFTLSHQLECPDNLQFWKRAERSTLVRCSVRHLGGSNDTELNIAKNSKVVLKIANYNHRFPVWLGSQRSSLVVTSAPWGF